MVSPVLFWLTHNGRNKKETADDTPTHRGLRTLGSVKLSSEQIKVRKEQLKSFNGEPEKSIDDFVADNAGLTENIIVHQRGRVLVAKVYGQGGGPDVRYISDPLNADAVIDLTHMLVVGRNSQTIGNMLEAYQLFTGSTSAFNFQDFYSNDLGRRFYGYYGNELKSNPNGFVFYLNAFLNNPSIPRMNYDGSMYYISKP